MKLKNLSIIILLAITSSQSIAQELWTIGPMFHWNFSEGKRSRSFSIEAAYWNIRAFPHSVDFGIEFDKGKLRLYSEGQTGIGVTGISFGPVLEFNFKERKVNVGLQGSCWMNYILGVDYRLRVIDKKKINCFGLYGKLPFETSGFESDGDGYDRDWDWD